MGAEDTFLRIQNLFKELRTWILDCVTFTDKLLDSNSIHKVCLLGCRHPCPSKLRWNLWKGGTLSLARRWLARLLQLWCVCFPTKYEHLPEHYPACSHCWILWWWWPGSSQLLLQWLGHKRHLQTLTIHLQYGLKRLLFIPTCVQTVSLHFLTFDGFFFFIDLVNRSKSFTLSAQWNLGLFASTTRESLRLVSFEHQEHYQWTFWN